MAQAKGGRGGTREQVVAATLATLEEGGLSNASARAIARTGGFNSALIFYYFGSLDGVLLAALEAASSTTMRRWTAALEAAGSPDELLAAALRLYREDVASGHTTVVAELIGAGHARPALRPAIVAATEPWIDLAEATVRRVLAGSPLSGLVEPRTLAYALIAFSLGVNLFAYLDADDSRVGALLDAAERAAPLAATLLAASAGPD